MGNIVAAADSRRPVLLSPGGVEEFLNRHGISRCYKVSTTRGGSRKGKELANSFPVK